MAKILNTDDLLEIATDPNEGKSIPGTEDAVQGVIDAVDLLAQKLADHYGINKGETTWEGKAFAGLCACFSPKTPDQPCPEPIHEGDPGGDWD